MNSFRWFGLASLLLLVPLIPAQAMMIAPQPLAGRVAMADSIVIGKVIGFEQKSVSAGRFPGDKDKTEYTVAIVKIEDVFGNLANVKRVENVRVGYIPPPPLVVPGPGGQPGGPIVRPIRRLPTFQLVKDQEVCLLLNPHHEGNFYTAPAIGGAIIKNKDNPQAFNTEVDEVKRCVKLLANPKAGLESKDANERLLTVGLLLTRYRAQPAYVQNPKLVDIDAKQSKAILLTLAEADWAKVTPGMFQMNPQNLFFRLGLTAKDGWTQPKDFKQVPEAAKQWLKDNADKYRIQRFVAPEKSEK